MSDIEKGSTEHISMPPPPAYYPSGRQSFNPGYEQHVNENMRDFKDEEAAPVQAFDKMKQKSRFPSKKRQLMYFAIGCALILTITLIGYFVLGRPHNIDKDARETPSVDAVTVTDTTNVPSITSSASIVISQTTEISTTNLATSSGNIITTQIISPTTTTVTPQSIADATTWSYVTTVTPPPTTWMTTLSPTRTTPSSTADAASSRSAVALASISSAQEADRSAYSAALTKYPSVSPAPPPLPPPSTIVTIITPPPTTTTTTLPQTDDAPPAAKDSTTSIRNWVNFCGVPGQGCG